MRLQKSILIVGLLGGAGWFLTNFRIEGLENLRVVPRSAPVSPSTAGRNDELPVGPSSASGVVRIATFNIQVFGEAKLANQKVVNLLAEVVRKFDIVALQEIRSHDDELLAHFLQIVNLTGRHYDCVVGPRLGNSGHTEQYAYLFDRATIEVDREAVYTVRDPDNLLHREPLVASFRVRGPPSDEAFTFTLVDVHTSPDDAKQEVDALADTFRAVRADGRGEDDIIMLGDFNVDDYHFGRLAAVSDVRWVISGVPTNTRGDQQYDNLLFGRSATTEFTGRAGVFDLIREFNLTMREALEISDHFPVWAEFSAYEGGRSGRVANRAENGFTERRHE